MTSPPVLTRDQVREVDRAAIEEFGVPSIVLMENAGRNAAEKIIAFAPDAREAVIFCGVGNNGGDGLVIARHLDAAGWRVEVVMAGDASRMTPDARTNADIARRMGLPIRPFFAWDSDDDVQGGSPRVLVDALLGTGFHGEVREPMASVIRGLREAGRSCVAAVDVPSGFDCQSGVASDPCVVADLTVTFVARKVGFDEPGAEAYLGRVEVVGIGAPRAILDRFA